MDCDKTTTKFTSSKQILLSDGGLLSGKMKNGSFALCLLLGYQHGSGIRCFACYAHLLVAVR